MRFPVDRGSFYVLTGMVIGYVWLVGYTLDTAVTWLQLSQDTLKMDATEATTQVYGASYIKRPIPDHWLRAARLRKVLSAWAPFRFGVPALFIRKRR